MNGQAHELSDEMLARIAANEQFLAEATKLGKDYYDQPITEMIKQQIKAEFASMLFRLYAMGSFVLDNRGQPIWKYEELEVVAITRILDEEKQTGAVDLSIVRKLS